MEHAEGIQKKKKKEANKLGCATMKRTDLKETDTKEGETQENAVRKTALESKATGSEGPAIGRARYSRQTDRQQQRGCASAQKKETDY